MPRRDARIISSRLRLPGGPPGAGRSNATPRSRRLRYSSWPMIRWSSRGDVQQAAGRQRLCCEMEVVRAGRGIAARVVVDVCCEMEVVRAGRGIAARVVVDEDEAAGVEPDGVPEQLAHPDQRRADVSNTAIVTLTVVTKPSSGSQGHRKTVWRLGCASMTSHPTRRSDHTRTERDPTARPLSIRSGNHRASSSGLAHARNARSGAAVRLRCSGPSAGSCSHLADQTLQCPSQDPRERPTLRLAERSGTRPSRRGMISLLHRLGRANHDPPRAVQSATGKRCGRPQSRLRTGRHHCPIVSSGLTTPSKSQISRN